MAQSTTQQQHTTSTPLKPSKLPAAPTTASDELETAHRLFTEWGMAMVPISSKSKAPASATGDVKQWGARLWQPQDFSGMNWGVILGARSSGLIDIDIDINIDSPHYKAITTIIKDTCLPYKPLLVGRGGKLRHIIFRVHGRPSDTNDSYQFAIKDEYQPQPEEASKKDHLELRLGLAEIDPEATGLQSVVWGRHPSGQKLVWWLPEGDSKSPDGLLGTISYSTLMIVWQGLNSVLGQPKQQPAKKPASQPTPPAEGWQNDNLIEELKADTTCMAAAIHHYFHIAVDVPMKKPIRCPIPAHEDKNASFRVSAAKGAAIGICSTGCPSAAWSRSGNGFNVLQLISEQENLRMEGADFWRILEIACQFAGRKLPESRDSQKQQPAASARVAASTSTSAPAKPSEPYGFKLRKPGTATARRRQARRNEAKTSETETETETEASETETESEIETKAEAEVEANAKAEAEAGEATTSSTSLAQIRKARRKHHLARQTDIATEAKRVLEEARHLRAEGYSRTETLAAITASEMAAIGLPMPSPFEMIDVWQSKPSPAQTLPAGSLAGDLSLASHLDAYGAASEVPLEIALTAIEAAACEAGSEEAMLHWQRLIELIAPSTGSEQPLAA